MLIHRKMGSASEYLKLAGVERKAFPPEVVLSTIQGRVFSSKLRGRAQKRETKERDQLMTQQTSFSLHTFSLFLLEQS